MRHEARQVPSWLIFDVRQKMKVVAAILLLCGFGNLVAASDGGAVWWAATFSAVIGGALIAVAVGILRKKAFAWPLGFAAIGLGATHFVVGVLSFAIGKEGVARTVIISSCLVGALLVTAYWSWLWYRQREYFFSQ